MKNLREQDGCWNCKHHFRQVEFDDPDTLYCTYKHRPRPPCGSTAMGESFAFSIDKKKRLSEKEKYKVLSKMIEDWEAWSKDREVHEYNICDNYLRIQK